MIRPLVVPAAIAAVLVAALGTPAAQAPAAPTAAPSDRLTAGQSLPAGGRLVAANGRFTAGVERDGRLVVRSAAGRLVWAGPRTAPRAVLALGRTGQLTVRGAGPRTWSTGTAGSGARDVLTMQDDGVLALSAGTALVWSTRVPNACPAGRGKAVDVDLGRQLARMCIGRQQVRATAVTTGASARGLGTPTGRWRVQARARDVTLRPSSGGAYPVRYWLPYDGAYGFHDSPWQRFPYGSPRYRTAGSHGCVHLPAATMAWLYRWAPPGTAVVVHR